MIQSKANWMDRLLRIIPENGESPKRYQILRRRITILMVLASLVPLVLMAVINHYQYQRTIMGEVVGPFKVLLNKTKHTFELFLAERLSTVSFIASAYSVEQLADQATLQRIFSVMKQEFGGFVDLGFIDSSGVQVSYVGPYKLQGKNYADQSWFQETQVRGVHISDVFMGFRRFPHFVIAVKRTSPSGEWWILRATIDTQTFNNIISSMGLEANTDAFLINTAGTFQTPSKFYGRVLDSFPLPLPPVSTEPSVIETVNQEGEDVLLGYVYFSTTDFVLILIRPGGEILKTWISLKSELFFVFVLGVIFILFVVFRLTGGMVRRIEVSDQRRTMMFHEMEYTNKLASIGRLAAGVAHEINNPLAIINEKAGLMKDVIEHTPDFGAKDKFLPLVESILKSVDRCRAVTHRLLGFARRMEVSVEVLDLNDVLKEVVGFLEKEALHRNIDLRLELDEHLPQVASDRGQLQQVLLNILNNAFAAVSEGGRVAVTSYERDMDTLGITIKDNGTGMSEEVLSHIFEPFFTTKKGTGTGLGLSITYGIIKKLGGDITVTSKEGVGTTFNVFLPKKAKGDFQSST